MFGALWICLHFLVGLSGFVWMIDIYYIDNGFVQCEIVMNIYRVAIVLLFILPFSLWKSRLELVRVHTFA